MIIPEKHIKLDKTLLGLGALVLPLFSSPIYVEEAWKKYLKSMYAKKKQPVEYDNFILILDFLFMIGAINTNDNNQIHYATN